MTAVVLDDPQYAIGRSVTDEDLARWVSVGETFRSEPEILSFIEQTDPEHYRELCDYWANLVIQARSAEWRSPWGGRPDQLLPGTDGSFSDKTDWSTFLLCGGRGSGKSRCGAEAVREICLARKWGIKQPEVALVGRRMEDVRVTMIQNTLLPVLPPGSVRHYNKSTCEIWLANGVYMRGYSSQAPDNVRGPNLVLAWGDEFASWEDADRSPAAEDTTLSNLRNALRISDGNWSPRLILTTTPKSVRGLRNIDPSDPMNPGPGIYDDPFTVVSNMSTLDNLANLSPHFLRTVVEPLKGTRLYRQEIEGHLVDATLGAMWTLEQIEEMTVDPSTPQHRAAGLRSIVIGVDPSIDGGQGDECGIVVAGLGFDGKAYVLEDASVRADSTVWSRIIKAKARQWDVDAIIVEENQGGELVESVLTRDAINLPLVGIHAKRGKYLRAEPVALLSDRGRVLLAGDFPVLTRQMTNFAGQEPGQDSPDRLDAFVYAIRWLLPDAGFKEDMLVKRRRRR